MQTHFKNERTLAAQEDKARKEMSAGLKYVRDPVRQNGATVLDDTVPAVVLPAAIKVEPVPAASQVTPVDRQANSLLLRGHHDAAMAVLDEDDEDENSPASGTATLTPTLSLTLTLNLTLTPTITQD